MRPSLRSSRAVRRAVPLRAASPHRLSAPPRSEKDKDEWIGAIGRAIVQTSSMFTGEDGMEYDSDDSDDNGELTY